MGKMWNIKINFIWIALAVVALCSCKKDEPEITLAQVSTIAVEVNGDQKATAFAEVTDAGEGKVSVRGVCWNTTGQPTVNDSYLNSDDGLGDFSVDIMGLTGGATYYLRSFATNEAGTAYGNSIQFTTESLPSFNYFGATIYVHPHDNAPYSVWAMGNNFIDATSLGYGSGNTIEIANAHSVSAAGVCHNLEAFGHNDWYLPAINELVAVYENMDDPESFPNTFYWSSTEESAQEAVALNFDSGEIENDAKNVQLGCRCIRKQY